MIAAIPESEDHRLVQLEGCDCVGYWDGAHTYDDDNYEFVDGERTDVPTMLLGRLDYLDEDELFGLNKRG